LTGDSLRHYYFVNRLAENHQVVGVVSEKTKVEVIAPVAELHPLVRLYYGDILEKENLYFGNDRQFKFDVNDVLSTTYDQSTASFIHVFIGKRNPDYIVVFDAPPLVDTVFETYREKVLHLHTGLLNYYDGSNANLWPIVEGYPERIGMTVHLVEQGNDEGRLLGQIRPALVPSDGIGDIDLKAVIAGTTLMDYCISGYHARLLSPHAFLRSEVRHTTADLTPEKILKAKQAIQKGMLQTFVDQRIRVTQESPIDAVLQ
jgi:methionyl-tRNA formyltransferase